MTTIDAVCPECGHDYFDAYGTTNIIVTLRMDASGIAEEAWEIRREEIGEDRIDYYECANCQHRILTVEKES